MTKSVLSGVVWLLAVLYVGQPVVAASCEVPPALVGNRPDPEGVPTEVLVGTYLIDLWAIQDSQQTFEADTFLFMSWQDPRLVAEDLPESMAGCNLDLDAVWNPRPVIVNERDVRRLLPNRVTISADGTVEYVQRFQGKFSTALPLADFPFDRHELAFDVVARAFSPAEVEFVLEVRMGAEERLSITDWEMGPPTADLQPKHIAAIDRDLAQVSFRLPVRRRLGYYFMKTFIPLTLIIFMSAAVFWIHPSQLPPQIGVATSAILTLIAFQFSLGYMLPRLSYLTRADRFLMGSTLLVFLAFAEALRTSYLAKTDREERALTIDRKMRWLFPLLYLGVIVISFVI